VVQFTSSRWNEVIGVCSVHGLPQTPCAACLHEHHKDVRVIITYSEKEVANMEGISIRDLLPVDGDWLMDRIL
jgi:cytidine deaminase